MAGCWPPAPPPAVTVLLLLLFLLLLLLILLLVVVAWRQHAHTSATTPSLTHQLDGRDWRHQVGHDDGSAKVSS